MPFFEYRGSRNATGSWPLSDIVGKVDTGVAGFPQSSLSTLCKSQTQLVCHAYLRCQEGVQPVCRGGGHEDLSGSIHCGTWLDHLDSGPQLTARNDGFQTKSLFVNLVPQVPAMDKFHHTSAMRRQKTWNIVVPTWSILSPKIPLRCRSPVIIGFAAKPDLNTLLSSFSADMKLIVTLLPFS